MKYNIGYTPFFERQLKRLVKKHRSIKKDLSLQIGNLEADPLSGTPIGNNCFKIRLSIRSKERVNQEGVEL